MTQAKKYMLKICLGNMLSSIQAQGPLVMATYVKPEIQVLEFQAR